jgi:hypothetical protein
MDVIPGVGLRGVEVEVEVVKNDCPGPDAR